MRTCANPECQEPFTPNRPWQVYCCRQCTARDYYLRRLRRRPLSRAQVAHNALKRIPMRVYCRRAINPGAIRQALALAGLAIVGAARPGRPDPAYLYMRAGEANAD